MPTTVELGRNKEDNSKLVIPPLGSLLDKSLPQGIDHPHWSPIQKLSAVANEIDVLQFAPDSQVRDKKILDQVHELKLIFSQLSAEATNGHKPSFQVFALFALMCDQVAKLSPRANRGQLYAMAENAIAKSSDNEGSYHAPLSLLGAEMAIAAAEYCVAEDIKLVAADPDNDFASSMLEEIGNTGKLVEALTEKPRFSRGAPDRFSQGASIHREILNARQQVRLIRPVVSKSPAERKFFKQNGDVRAGYLLYAENYLERVASLVRDSEKGNKLVFTLSDSEKKKAGEIRMTLDRLKANKLNGMDLSVGINTMVTIGNLSRQEVEDFCYRIDLSTFDTLSEDDLDRLMTLIRTRSDHQLIFQPLTDVIRTEQLRRTLLDSQMEYSSDKLSKIGLLSAEIERYGDIKTSARCLVRLAEYYIDHMVAEQRPPGRWRRFFAGRNKKNEPDFGALALSAIHRAIEKIKILISEAAPNDPEQKPIELQKQLAEAYVRYLNKINQPSANFEASNYLVRAGFDPTAYELITRMVNIRESAIESAASGLDKQSAYKARISELEAIVYDATHGKNEKIKARLELAELYDEANEQPLKIVELLWCEEFNLRQYSQQVDKLDELGMSDQLDKNPLVKNPRLYSLRKLLAEKILAVVEAKYANVSLLPEHKGEIWVMLNEAKALHMGITQSARILHRKLYPTVPSQNK